MPIFGRKEGLPPLRGRSERGVLHSGKKWRVIKKPCIDVRDSLGICLARKGFSKQESNWIGEHRAITIRQ